MREVQLINALDAVSKTVNGIFLVDYRHYHLKPCVIEVVIIISILYKPYLTSYKSARELNYAPLRSDFICAARTQHSV
ncbi:unnamed protein product [Parnassius mnemosyne]|uniref:Uncharacterized protein n=1 Tax=Parnassius mnemosyne TaxID=213953 RepID=A0AAV1LT07_9NEOP